MYADVVTEVADELHARVAAVLEGGVAADRVIVDPGLGFSKGADHDLALLAHLDRLLALGHPVLVAASRKRFLGRVLAGPDGAPRPRGSATRPPRPSPRSPRGPARGRSACTRYAPPRTPYGSPVPSRRHAPRPRTRRARRRRSPVSAPHTDVEQVEAANTAFYEAVERGDFEGVASLWLTPATSASTSRTTTRRTPAWSPACTPAGRCSPDAARSSGRTP
ncbi:hypothetical protein SHKM778_04910 [Streptomyces sp. KM77-8]|uniref:Pterin-binding domain-containing protein n=1 Tax=Streptomyces haneummycinicus TaxID=3074435 RepID=A0AAT9H9N7_9ACTN